MVDDEIKKEIQDSHDTIKTAHYEKYCSTSKIKINELN